MQLWITPLCAGLIHASLPRADVAVAVVSLTVLMGDTKPCLIAIARAVGGRLAKIADVVSAFVLIDTVLAAILGVLS